MIEGAVLEQRGIELRVLFVICSFFASTIRVISASRRRLQHPRHGARDLLPGTAVASKAAPNSSRERRTMRCTKDRAIASW
jgi:hypothetical protein